MRVGHLPAWLGGGQRDVLAVAPGDATRYGAMGAVLIGTASVAALSAAFALHTAVRLPMPAALAVGVLWGLLVLSLDRMLVVTMARQAGFWRNLAAALPRLALALVIGAVVSAPLVLRIFEPEIDSELQVMHAEHVIDNQRTLDAQYADIPVTQQKVAELQAVVNGRGQPNVSDDPDVRAARATLAAAQRAYDDAARRAQCELDGSCGSGSAGRGPAWRAAKALADRASARLTTVRQETSRIEQATAERIDGDAATARAAAGRELATLLPGLTARVQERDAAQRRLTDVEQRNSGLLARLEALDRLTAGRPTLAVAHWALIALFASVELLPVVAKLLSAGGPPSLYEQLVTRREHDVLDDEQLRSDRRRQIVAVRADVRTRLEQHRADLQVSVGREANARLAATQQEVADRAVAVWGEVAKRRTDEELARWYARHLGTRPDVPPTPPEDRNGGQP
ncbi:DUF4407 domain-containing protein [Micromonospora sp. WMMD882]|uniref:DUF4407 domain-containing protein n=1 Tax=Micromonospora sp. WMMD882 TaxID=3015151 RepID=UPI00248D1532|nr:DUF4407 domain-containing protein [Micromonospora sp. WMMD882]WBB80600.1 DUF4407 domain-containing protein [Micromonospora sp. WMMD882]